MYFVDWAVPNAHPKIVWRCLLANKMFVLLPVAGCRRQCVFGARSVFVQSAVCQRDDDMHDYQRRNYAMLLEVAEFTRFTKPTIADPKTSCEVIIALAFERRDAVDLMMTHCFRVVAPNVLSQRTMD